MKKNILLFFIIVAGIPGQSQTPQVPSGKPGKVALPVPKIQPITPPPAKVAFEAVVTDLATPRSPLRFDAVIYNDGNGFSSSENAFIAPTAGLYFFSVNLNWNGYGCEYIPGSASVTAMKNGRESLRSSVQTVPGINVGACSNILAFSTKLNAGDKITIAVVNILCNCDLISGI